MLNPDVTLMSRVGRNLAKAGPEGELERKTETFVRL
jgi:hypothetical protein